MDTNLLLLVGAVALLLFSGKLGLALPAGLLDKLVNALLAKLLPEVKEVVRSEIANREPVKETKAPVVTANADGTLTVVLPK